MTPFEPLVEATSKAPDIPVITQNEKPDAQNDSGLTDWQQRVIGEYEETGAAFGKHGPNTWNIHKRTLAKVLDGLGVELPTNSGDTDPAHPNGSLRFHDNGTIAVYSFSKETGWRNNGGGSYIVLEPPVDLSPRGGVVEAQPKTKAECILAIAERDEHFHSGKTPVVGFTWRNKRYVLKLPNDEYIRLLIVRVRAEFDKLVTERNVKNILPHVVQHCFDGPERKVFTRVGCHADKIYIDLADASHRAIEIDKDGWRVVDNPPIIFTRSDLITPLPMPTKGGSLYELRPFLNLGNDDFAVAIAYLIGCWNPYGPFPSLAFVGPAGIAKSTSVRFMQAVVDPSETPNGKQRACHSPTNPEDVLVHAGHRWLVFLDNLSKMNDKLSDLCCLFATGGGTIKRKLYSDSDFAELSVEQPLVLGMVNDLIQKEDLRSRTLFLFPPMLDSYRPEREMLNEFSDVLPHIVGALADAVSCALRNQDKVKGCEKLRFADFIQWVVASEPATDFEPGTFERVLTANRRHSAEQVVDTQLGNAICELATEGVKLRPEKLFNRLRQMDVDDVSSPVWLSRRLNELAGEFAQCGVSVSKTGKHWTIKTA